MKPFYRILTRTVLILQSFMILYLLSRLYSSCGSGTTVPQEYHATGIQRKCLKTIDTAPDGCDIAARNSFSPHCSRPALPCVP